MAWVPMLQIKLITAQQWKPLYRQTFNHVREDALHKKGSASCKLQADQINTVQSCDRWHGCLYRHISIYASIAGCTATLCFVLFSTFHTSHQDGGNVMHAAGLCKQAATDRRPVQLCLMSNGVLLHCFQQQLPCTFHAAAQAECMLLIPHY